MTFIALILLALGIASLGSAFLDPESPWNRWQLRLMGGRKGARVFFVVRGVSLVVVAVVLLVGSAGKHFGPL